METKDKTPLTKEQIVKIKATKVAKVTSGKIIKK